MKLTFEQWLENNNIKSLSSLGITNKTKRSELCTMIEVMETIFYDDYEGLNFNEDEEYYYLDERGSEEIFWTNEMAYLGSGKISLVNKRYEEIPGNKVGDSNYQTWLNENIYTLEELYFKLKDDYAHIVRNIEDVYDVVEFRLLTQDIDFQTINLENTYVKKEWVKNKETNYEQLKYKLVDKLSLEQEFKNLQNTNQR